MELQHAIVLGFIKPVPTSGVFAIFPVSARRELATTLSQCLLTMNPRPEQVDTTAHVDTVAEGIGQAFSLPLDEGTDLIILKCLDVYKLWMLNEKFRPEPVAENMERYCIMFLRQISSVFAPRSDGTIIAHLTLCTKALDVILQLVTDLGSTWSSATYEEFLKILLAVTDSLLSQPLGTLQIADQLQNQLLGFLYQIWLLSGTQSEGLWQIWKSLMQSWRHRTVTIKIWNSVLYGLSSRLIGITFGNNDGKKDVAFIMNHETVELNMKDDHVVYSWYKVLHILGDLEQIDQVDVYHVAMHGLSKLTRMFTSVEAPIDGNSLLHALGPHVLEAVTTFPAGRDLGKSVALDTVCKLFQSKAKTTIFHPSYLALYYNGLEQALRSGSYDLLSVVITNSVHLLSAEFRGVNMLIPALISGVSRVLTHKGNFPKSKADPNDLRKGALRLLVQMLCLAKRFGETTFKVRETPTDANDKDNDLPSIVTYADLNPHIEHVLLACLDTFLGVKDLLFSAAYVYIVENFGAETSSFGSDFLAKLLSQITCSADWPDAETISCLKFFIDMSHHFLEFGSAISSKVVGTMCSLIEKQMVKGSSGSASTVIVTHALYVAHRWTLDGRWVLTRQPVMKRYWAAIDMCMNGGENVVPPSRDIQLVGNFCMAKLLHNMAGLKHPERMDSPNREINVLEDLRLQLEDMCCFIFDETLFSVIKHPTDGQQIKVTVITRDAIGRFCWELSLNYFGGNEVPEVKTFSCEPGGILPVAPPEMFFEEDFFAQLIEGVPPEDPSKPGGTFQALLESVKENHELVKQIRQRQEEEKGSHGLVRPDPTRRALPSNDTTPLRMFLNTLGYTALSAQDLLHLIQPGELPNYLAALDMLDCTHCRERYTIPVHYVPAGQQVDICFTGGSPVFYDFVQSLGWYPQADLNEEAWEPAFLASEVGPGMRYYCDEDLELLFFFPSIMHTEEEAARADICSNHRVQVCWCEDVSLFVPRADPQMLTAAIHPYPNGLCQLRFFKGGIPHPGIGPLRESCIVSLDVLTKGLRATLVNMCRDLNGYNFGNEVDRRRGKISFVVSEHSNNMTFSKKYASLFTRQDVQ